MSCSAEATCRQGAVMLKYLKQCRAAAALQIQVMLVLGREQSL